MKYLIAFFISMMFIASITSVNAATKTKYPPYEDEYGDKDGAKNGGGYWYSNYYVNRQTGNIRLYALGEGTLGGGASADAIGFMGTYWPDVPSGCPYISTWNGTQYVLDNNILGDSEASNGTNVEDYYKLEQMLVPIRKSRRTTIYSVLISEFENEYSYLDQVTLMIVEHLPGVNVAVSTDGEFLTYKKPHQPIFCVDNHGINRLEIISIIDDNYYMSHPHDYLLLDFGKLDVSQAAKLVIRANVEFKKDLCIHVQTLNKAKEWIDRAVIRTRNNWSTVIVNLINYLPNPDGTLKIRLYFTGIHRIDYIGLDTSVESDLNILHCQLKSAKHSEVGEVKSKLINADGQYAELSPGEKIQLKFALLEKPIEPYVFVIFSTGYYFSSKSKVDTGSAIKVVSPTLDPIVFVTSKLTLMGWAKVCAISATPLAARGSWYVSIELWVYDYTAESWVTTTVVQEWSDEIKSPGEFIPVWREKHWNADYDVQSSFPAINGHYYGVWVGVYVYASGFAIGGDGYGLVDFDHSSYGDHDIWVRYIHLTW